MDLVDLVERILRSCVPGPVRVNSDPVSAAPHSSSAPPHLSSGPRVDLVGLVDRVGLVDLVDLVGRVDLVDVVGVRGRASRWRRR